MLEIWLVAILVTLGSSRAVLIKGFAIRSLKG